MADLGVFNALLLVSLVISYLYVSGLTEAKCPDWRWEPEAFGLPLPQGVVFSSADGIRLSGWYFPGGNGQAPFWRVGLGLGVEYCPLARISRLEYNVS